MSFESAGRYLDALGVDAMKSLTPTLHRIEALMEALNHPEAQIPAIHITGTNGKTSTARIATSILNAVGLSVGTFTSPHLQTVRERIALNDEPISEETFGETFDHLHPYLQAVEAEVGEQLSYFEVLVGMFFLWASETPVDAVIVEVGLGGVWDATNVVSSSVAVITGVDLDHTAMLGQARTQIAAEKAGIIKGGTQVVLGERDPSLLPIFEAAAASSGSEISLMNRDFVLLENELALGGRSLAVQTETNIYRELLLPLHGAHQGHNAALAIEACGSFLPEGSLGEEVIREGIGNTNAPGRMETVRPPGSETPIILDVAHNPAGMSALVSSLSEAFAFEQIVFVVGILHDKDHRGMLLELTRVPCRVIATEARDARSLPAEQLDKIAAELGLHSEPIPSVQEAVAHAIESTPAEDVAVVTGSHYVVGEARSHLVG